MLFKGWRNSGIVCGKKLQLKIYLWRLQYLRMERRALNRGAKFRFRGGAASPLEGSLSLELLEFCHTGLNKISAGTGLLLELHSPL